MNKLIGKTRYRIKVINLNRKMKGCMPKKDFCECKAIISRVLAQLPESKKEGLIDRLLEVIKWQVA